MPLSISPFSASPFAPLRRSASHALWATGFFLLTCQAASASVFSGSFAGKVDNSTWPGMLDGTAITGKFYFDSGFAYALEDTDGASFAHYSAFNVDSSADPIHLSFVEPDGKSLDINGFGVLDVWLYDTPGGQAVSFSSYFVHGVGAALTLAGGRGDLFDTLDIGSLNMAKPTAVGSFGHMAFHGQIENDVLLDSVALDAAVSVPEPATAILSCLGLVSLLGTRLRYSSRRSSR